MGAGVLTVADGSSLAAARRSLVVGAVDRLRARCPSGDGGPVSVQGVQLVGRDAAGVTTFGALAHAVGADAAGYALVRTRRNRPVIVDLDTWARRDDANPLVRVLAVPVRCAELLRTAAAYGVHPEPAGTLDGGGAVRLAAALDAVPTVVTVAARGEPHRLADHLEQVVAPVHETVHGELHRGLSRVRDDPAGDDGAKYRSHLSVLARCAREVAAAVAVLGPVVPERL